MYLNSTLITQKISIIGTEIMYLEQYTFNPEDQYEWYWDHVPEQYTFNPENQYEWYWDHVPEQYTFNP